MVSAAASVLPTFDWYARVPSEAALEQGDIFIGFPVLEPPPPSSGQLEEAKKGVVPSLDADLKLYDLIVLTQSCDLRDLPSDGHVILCPLIDLKKATKSNGQPLATAQEWGNLRAGRHVGVHLINRCDIAGHEFDFKVVDLQRIISIPRSFVNEISTRAPLRIRLLPPYREHLAQAFARQFMRVGLPSVLPEKYPYTTPSSTIAAAAG